MKITAIVLLGLGVAALLRRQPAALRHWVLACAIACAAAAPILSLLVPAWQVGIVAPASTSAAVDSRAAGAGANRATGTGASPLPTRSSSAGSETPDDPARPLSWWLAVAWITGTSLGIGVILIGLGRLSWLGGRARSVSSGPWQEIIDQLSHEMALTRRVALLQSDHPSLLITWGTLRPKILFPAAALTWPAERIRIVLRHELAHIQRRDWAIQIGAEILKSIYWFNPALWIAGRQLRLESEHACDDAVLNSGVEASEYATHLVDLARALNQQPRTWLPAPAIARPSSLHRRISAMLNVRLNRRPVSPSLRNAIAAALVATTIAIAAAQAPYATVAGSVVDSSGGLIRGAVLTLSNSQNDSKHEVKSDATGHFEFVGLPAGEYVLAASSMGFAVLRETLTLSAGEVTNKNIALKLGSLQETITVVRSSTPRPDGALPGISLSRRAAPAAKGPCTASSMGGAIVPPMKVTDVKPRFPANLRDSEANGAVELEATIGADGSVTSVNVVGSPQVDMAAAAAEAVRQWQFTPTLLNCAPTEVHMNVSIAFRSQP